MSMNGPVGVITEMGEPIQVGTVRLVPVVRVMRMQRRFAASGETARPVGGMAVYSISPIAVHVLDSSGGRTLYVPRPERRVGLALLLSLVLMPLISMLIVRWLSNASRG